MRTGLTRSLPLSRNLGISNAASLRMPRNASEKDLSTQFAFNHSKALGKSMHGKQQDATRCNRETHRLNHGLFRPKSSYVRLCRASELNLLTIIAIRRGSLCDCVYMLILKYGVSVYHHTTTSQVIDHVTGGHRELTKCHTSYILMSP